MAECDKSEIVADTFKMADDTTDLNDSLPHTTTSVIRSGNYHQPLDLSFESPSSGESICEKQETYRTSMNKSLIPQPQGASTSAKYNKSQNNYKDSWLGTKFESALGFQPMIPIGLESRSQNRNIIEHYRFPNLEADFQKHILQRQAESGLGINRLIPTPDVLDEKEQGDKACSCNTRYSERKPEFSEESGSADNGVKSETEERIKLPQETLKSRKRKLSESKMNDDYLERRKKNNAAAKKSRDARRANEQKIAARAEYLENENLRLKIELETLFRNKHLYS